MSKGEGVQPREAGITGRERERERQATRPSWRKGDTSVNGAKKWGIADTYQTNTRSVE